MDTSKIADIMTVRIADIINDSIVDGPGLRMTIFSQGCPHICPGCHNPQTLPFDGGYIISCDEILRRAKKNPLLRGLTFSGGEPFVQAESFFYLAKTAAESHLDIVTYTGFTYEQLIRDATSENFWLELLSHTDILVDGPFVEALRTLDTPFVGSKNQRVIDVKASMAHSEIVLFKFA